MERDVCCFNFGNLKLCVCVFKIYNFFCSPQINYMRSFHHAKPLKHVIIIATTSKIALRNLLSIKRKSYITNRVDGN